MGVVLVTKRVLNCSHRRAVATVQLDLNLKNSRHALHEQQKIRGMLASARELDDVSTACRE